MNGEQPRETNQLPFYVTGKVVKGFGRGSAELGIPTANIDYSVVKNLPLSTGIYFGLSQLVVSQEELNELTEDQRDKLQSILTRKDQNWISPVYMMSSALGYNPYYNNKKKTLEIHILDQFDCNLYGVTINSLICGKIREEENFNSLEDLIRTINRDIELTRDQLSKDSWSSSKSDERYFIQS